jgi:hypothetical protein
VRADRLAAVVLALIAATCTGGATPTTPPPAPVTATTTVPPTTTTMVTTTTVPGATGDPAIIAERCGTTSFLADVDGDGVADPVYHRYEGSEAVLGVCTASGVDEIPGGGMTEILFAYDVGGDGSFELFYGGTSVTAGITAVAVWIDGELQVASEAGGRPLLVYDGWLNAAEGPFLSFGCRDVDGDGVTELLQAEFADGGSDNTVPDGAPIAWTFTAYSLDGALVTRASEGQGEVVAPLTLADRQQVTGVCPAA